MFRHPLLAPSADAPPPVARWELAVVGAMLLLALALRLWLLPQVPGLWYDEAIYALDGLKVLREPGWPIFFSTYDHMREPLYIYMQAIGLWLGGTTAIAARSVSLVVGMATLLLLWWVARSWRGVAFGLAALFILATMRWHITFSVLAFRTITAPLLALATAHFYLRVVQGRGGRGSAIACGAMLGVGLYTYLAFRLFPFILLVPALVELATRWRAGPRDEARRLLRLMVWAAGTALVVFAPLGINYLRHPEHFFGRGNEVTLGGRGEPIWQVVARQARDVAMMPLLRGDHVGKHNIPGPPQFLQWGTPPPADETVERWELEQQFAAMEGRAPMDRHGTGLPALALVAGLLFYAGFVALVLAARRDPGARLLLAWLLIGSLASVLSYGAPNMLRLMMVTPAVALTVAWGAWWLVALPRGLWIVAVLLAINAAMERALLRTWPTHPLVIREFNTEWADVGKFLAAQPDRLPVVLPPMMLPPAPTLLFLADGYEFVSAPPDNAAAWWEFHGLPPFPTIESPSTPAPGARVHRAMHPAGIPFADIVEIRRP